MRLFILINWKDIRVEGVTRVEKSSEKWRAPPCLTCWVRLGVDVQHVGDTWITVCRVVCHAAFKIVYWVLSLLQGKCAHVGSYCVVVVPVLWTHCNFLCGSSLHDHSPKLSEKFCVKCEQNMQCFSSKFTCSICIREYRACCVSVLYM